MADKTKYKQYCFGVIFSSLLILADQLTKVWAVRNLMDKEPISILDGVFQLRYLENRGAAFGLMNGLQWLFLIGTVICVVIIFYVYAKTPVDRKYRFLRIIMVLLFSGALGNAIDRIRQNYVVDFLYFELIDFPIFNVADCYVTIGSTLLLITFFFYYKEQDFDYLFHKKQID